MRDAEIENILWNYADPILRVAGIDSNAMTINLVGLDDLNAFVAGGPNLFLFTGLLLRSESPEQVIGVIAHEVGHIAGSHNVRTQDALANAQIQSIVTMILGFALAIASGESGFAAAGAAGGSALAGNNFLAYSRAQESAADQAGITYLETIGVSSKGLHDFLKVLENEEFLVVGRQSPYFRTHPVTRDRMNFIAKHLQDSRFTDAKLPKNFYHWHRIMKAKLFAFLRPPATVLNTYSENDTSIAARYARAIAYYRVPDLDKALPIIDGLIADHPDNPYFHELKGQMLFENGRGAEAAEPYMEAVRLLPQSALLRTQLAQVLIERNDPALNRLALSNLKESARSDSRSGLTWHLLAVAYGREGDIGMAALSLAEKALLQGNFNLAIQQSRRAMNLLKEGSVDWLRAEAIGDEAQRKRPSTF